VVGQLTRAGGGGYQGSGTLEGVQHTTPPHHSSFSPHQGSGVGHYTVIQLHIVSTSGGD